jgi:CBS domain-containing protein
MDCRTQEVDMRVVDIMTKNVTCVASHEALSTAARLMWDCDCGALPVVDGEGKAIGMITDRDICMATWSRDQSPSQLRVSDGMSRQVFCCSSSDSLADAKELMRQKQIRRIPVVDTSGRLCGIVSLADIARLSDIPLNRPVTNELGPEEIARTLANICQPPQGNGAEARA